MQYASWERSSRKKLGYHRRCPVETPLYRILDHYREKLESEWEERFREKYGVLSSVVLYVFDKYLDCGILLHGCARARCENCHHSILIALSCKRRGLCPSCDAKRTHACGSHIFAEHLHDHVLRPHAHRHLESSWPNWVDFESQNDLAMKILPPEGQTQPNIFEKNSLKSI